ncbi:hypothetical protein ZWY2020_044667 [Hordeum vulgare]|nr:hypothetical protein ZWY2020_044667 [Hordeum vulgare]
MAALSLASCLWPRKKAPPPPADPRSRTPSPARTLAFNELAAATSNFRDDLRIVREASLYKAYLKSVNQVVAIKLQRDRSSSEQLNKEFLARVLTLSSLRHPNVVNLVGFCADGHHRVQTQQTTLLNAKFDTAKG